MAFTDDLLAMARISGKTEMPAKPFGPGVVVRLKSGGPKMTILHKIAGLWLCSWCNKQDELQEAYFPDEVLTYA